MGNLVPFVLVDNGGTGDVTVSPTGFANGVAEWTDAASRSQAYRVTASLRQASATNRKYTIKLEVPKKETQVVGGVELPVSAWKTYMSVDLTIPVYATNNDCALIVKAINGIFATSNPIASAIASNSGFY